jgi:ferredoxin
LRWSCSSQTSGEVEQGAGMLSDDVAAKGYALLCVAEPKGDVSMRIIEEVQVP